MWNALNLISLCVLAIGLILHMCISPQLFFLLFCHCMIYVVIVVSKLRIKATYVNR